MGQEVINRLIQMKNKKGEIESNLVMINGQFQVRREKPLNL